MRQEEVFVPYSNEYLDTLVAHLLPARSLVWHAGIFPVSVIASLHALRTAMFFRRQCLHGGRLPYLQGLFAMIVLSLGGTALTAFIFGRPPEWLLSNVVLPLYAAVYTLVFFSPGDLVYRILDPIFPIIDLFLIPADAASRAFASTVAGVDFIRQNQRFKGSAIAALLAGVLSGSGGGIVADTFGLTSRNWTFRTPAALTRPPLDVRAVFFGTLFYLMATDPWLWYGPAQSLLPQLLGQEAWSRYSHLVAPYRLGEDDAKAAAFVLICAILYWKQLLGSSYSPATASGRRLGSADSRGRVSARVGVSPFPPGTVAAAERAAAAASKKTH